MNRAQCLVIPTVSSVIPAKAGIQGHPEGLFQALHPLSTWWRGGRGVRPAPIPPAILSILSIHVNTYPSQETIAGPAALRQVVQHQVDDPAGTDDVEPHGQGNAGEAAMQPEVAAEGERDGDQDQRPHDDRQHHMRA